MNLCYVDHACGHIRRQDNDLKVMTNYQVYNDRICMNRCLRFRERHSHSVLRSLEKRFVVWVTTASWKSKQRAEVETEICISTVILFYCILASCYIRFTLNICSFFFFFFCRVYYNTWRWPCEAETCRRIIKYKKSMLHWWTRRTDIK
jgi:hypothetical protein